MIQWGIACGPQSAIFLDILLHSLEKTTTNLSELQLLLGMNSNTDHHSLLAQVAAEHPQVNCLLIETGVDAVQASHSHAQTLDVLLNQMTTEIGIVSDVDIVMLLPEWDLVIKEIMATHDFIGVPYSSKLRFRVTGLPTAFFMCFKPKLLHGCHFSFTPSKNIHKWSQILKSSKLRSLPNPELLQYGVTRVTETNKNCFPHNPVGTFVILDTGIDVYFKLLPCDFKYFTFSETVDHEITDIKRNVDLYLHQQSPLLTHFRKARKKCVIKIHHDKYLIRLDPIFFSWVKVVSKHLQIECPYSKTKFFLPKTI